VHPRSRQTSRLAGGAVVCTENTVASVESLDTAPTTHPRLRRRQRTTVAGGLAPAAFWVATSAAGQGNTVGHILGEVASRSEPLPGVLVTARNVDTAMRRSVATRGDGRYRFSALPVGRYQLR